MIDSGTVPSNNPIQKLIDVFQLFIYMQLNLEGRGNMNKNHSFVKYALDHFEEIHDLMKNGKIVLSEFPLFYLPKSVQNIVEKGETSVEEVIDMIVFNKTATKNEGWIKEILGYVKSNSFEILIVPVAIILMLTCFRSSCLVVEWMKKLKEEFACCLSCFYEIESPNRIMEAETYLPFQEVEIMKE